MKADNKKAKIINLSDACIYTLSVRAAEDKTNFKNYVEAHLEKLAANIRRERDRRATPEIS